VKILKKTESELIIGERGLGGRHWGLFILLLAGGGFTAITLTGGDFPPGPRIGLLVASVLGFLAAVFMGKNLTHRLDKTTGLLRVEYPVALDTKLEIADYRISDIKSIKKTKMNSWQQAMTSSSDLPSGRISYASQGFSYILKDGKAVESGIFSSEIEKVGKVIKTLSEFLSVPVE